MSRKLKGVKNMIKLEMDPRSDAKSIISWDCSWAADQSETFSELITNAGIEAQTAILAIISRMYERIVNLTTKKITKKDAKMIKGVLIKIACREVNIAALDEFRRETGRESGLVN